MTTGEVLLRQLDTAWSLTSYHLDGLTTEECLWRPAPTSLHVHLQRDGVWTADWPERESYDIGPASIGWTTWHIAFWWSMALDHSSGEQVLTRDRVLWPGTADGVRDQLGYMHRSWRKIVGAMDDAALASPERTRWPFAERPFADVVAWANLELMKNAAEIGSMRFLYAVRGSR